MKRCVAYSIRAQQYNVNFTMRTKKYLSLSEKFAHLNFFLDNSVRCANNNVNTSVFGKQTKLWDKNNRQ